MFDQPEVVVESVVIIPSGAIQLTYYETADMNEYVAFQRTVTIDTGQIAEEVDELQELLKDIVDKAWVIKRNPPKRLRRREQLESEEELEPEEQADEPAVVSDAD